MQKFITWMEENFAPKMNVINRNIWILTLKDSIMQVLPMIFVGSLVTILSIFQDYIPNFPDLWPLSSYSMGLISIFVSFLIPFNFMERKKYHKMRFSAGMAGFALYAVTIKLEFVQDIDFGVFGAGGMFAAIIVGVIAAIVMGIFGKFSFFKEDSALPDFVRGWFDSMLPIFLIILLGWIVVYGLDFDLYGVIIKAFSPLGNFAESLPGFILLYFIVVFFYTMGISVWVFTPIIYPIMMIPMWMQGVAIPLITYFVLRSGWVTIPSQVFGMWYCPFPISTWIVSKDIMGMGLIFVLFAVSALIWYPFFKIYDRQLIKLEVSSDDEDYK